MDDRVDDGSDRSRGLGGAAAGVVLLAGWVVVGAVLFRSGRRRLNAATTTPPASTGLEDESVPIDDGSRGEVPRPEQSDVQIATGADLPG